MSGEIENYLYMRFRLQLTNYLIGSILKVFPLIIQEVVIENFLKISKIRGVVKNSKL